MQRRGTAVLSGKMNFIKIVFSIFFFFLSWNSHRLSHTGVRIRSTSRHCAVLEKRWELEKKVKRKYQKQSFHVRARTTFAPPLSSHPAPSLPTYTPREAPPQEKIESRSLTRYDTGRMPSIFIETQAVNTEIAFDSPCLCLSPAGRRRGLHLAAARAPFKSSSLQMNEDRCS